MISHWNLYTHIRGRTSTILAIERLSERELDGRGTRKRNGQLEVARGRRDVVGVCDVYDSMCEGVFLRTAESGVFNTLCCALDTGEEESGWVAHAVYTHIILLAPKDQSIIADEPG